MKIMVLGAYGKAGQLIIQYAQQQQWNITAVAHKKHSEINIDGPQLLIKNVVDLTKQDIQGFDVIVDATGGWTQNTAHIIYDGLAHLVQLLDDGQKTRYIKVGGANTLYINRDHSQQLQDLSSYYPAKYKFLCNAHKNALDLLRTYSIYFVDLRDTTSQLSS